MESKIKAQGPLTWFATSASAFWSRATPNISAAISEINSSYRDHEELVPLRPENKNLAGVISTACDYFSALLIDQIPSSVFERLYDLDLILPKPVMSAFEPLYSKIALTLFSPELSKESKRVKELEISLARAHIFLAHVDSVFRTGRIEYLPDTSGLNVFSDKSNVRDMEKWLAKRIPKSAADECLDLVWELRELIPKTGKRTKKIYNPVFGAYGLITGSDGDLFIRDTLYDLKCTSSERGFRGADLKQLLGYCALNEINGLKLPIKHVAIINPRRGFVWKKSLPKVLESVGAGGWETFLSSFVHAARD